MKAFCFLLVQGQKPGGLGFLISCFFMTFRDSKPL